MSRSGSLVTLIWSSLSHSCNVIAERSDESRCALCAKPIQSLSITRAASFRAQRDCCNATGTVNRRPSDRVYTSTVTAEIIAIGSELLTPFFQDTNSLYLTEKLNELGVEVAFKTVVGDNRDHLTSAARTALAPRRHPDLHGRAGPDRGRPDARMRRRRSRPRASIAIRSSSPSSTSASPRCAARCRRTTNARRTSSTAPKCCPTRIGTAPGQWIELEHEGAKRYIMLLPGPPHEIKPMFDEQCVPRLRERVPRQFIATRVLKVAMMGGIGLRPARRADLQALHRRADHHPGRRRRDPASADRARRFPGGGAGARGRAGGIAGRRAWTISFTPRQGESLEQIVGYFLQMRGANHRRGGVLYRRNAGRADHQGQRQFAVLSSAAPSFTTTR